MLDTVRIAGRSIQISVLDRITRQTLKGAATSRKQQVERFCQLTQWVNRRGDLCLSSAAVALKRLETLGHVQLVPPREYHSSPRSRKLVDDGKPLPLLPKLPHSVGKIKKLRLELVTSHKDPNHLLWNRLIIRQHPLGAAPIVGAQLRYLIWCEHGVIGAFGFGPPAFHLECRDAWIGWDSKALEQNRNQVIGLARFLIRPGIKCANLASRCYSMVLKQVARDWQNRYLITPLLVETYVDRSTHTGRSLAAANWRRVGQSCGRGRSSPSAKVRPLTTKDVWVYELSKHARPRLQAREVERIVPRSIFQKSTSSSWTLAERDGMNLRSKRQEDRWGELLEARWRHPGQSLRASFPTAAEGKGLYRLMESKRPEVCFDSLLEPHCNQTQRRMAAEKVVILAQDTTALSYPNLQHTTGLGTLGDKEHSSRGFWLHSLHAYRTDRIGLGCCWAKPWVRSKESNIDQRNELSIAEKEGLRWIEAYQSAAYMAKGMPQTQLVVCGDRESDLFELYDQTQSGPENLFLLVRAKHDRILADGGKLWERLGSQEVGGSFEINVPRNKNRSARVATLTLKWTTVEVNPPSVALKKTWNPITLQVVMAQELNAPEDQKPIQWVLLTTCKVDSAKRAQRLIQWYGLRWEIECWHQILKDVYGVETRQMKTVEALQRALALDMTVAWRSQFLVRLGKKSPNLPASLYYSREELCVLEDQRSRLPERVAKAKLEPDPSKKKHPRHQPS